MLEAILEMYAVDGWINYGSEREPFPLPEEAR